MAKMNMDAVTMDGVQYVENVYHLLAPLSDAGIIELIEVLIGTDLRQQSDQVRITAALLASLAAFLLLYHRWGGQWSELQAQLHREPMEPEHDQS